MSYQPKVYMEQGGDAIVVQSGGEIEIKSGGTMTAAGTQASAIANVTAITGGESPTEAEHNAVITALNAALAALRGVGIIAAA